MERGFKKRCEEMAHSMRSELDLGPRDPLPADQLASYLDIPVWPVTALGLPEEDVTQLVERDSDAWSAITVSASGREAIIVNPRHRGGRFSSDVMHELAHLLLGHQPGTVFFTAEQDTALRAYDTAAEKEADWLAAALLLPRAALVQARLRRVPDRETCARYGVSQQMLTFRMKVTGVDRQFERRKTAAAQRR